MNKRKSSVPDQPLLFVIFATTANPYSGQSLGGAETSIRLLAKELARLGHKVAYLTRRVSVVERDLAAAEGVQLVEFWSVAHGRGHKKFGTALITLHLLWIMILKRPNVFYVYYERALLRMLLLARRLVPAKPVVMLRMAGMRWYVEIQRGGPRVMRLFEYIFNKVDSVNFLHAGTQTATLDKIKSLSMRVAFQDMLIADIGSSAKVGRRAPHLDLPLVPFRLIMATRFSDYQKRQDLLVSALPFIPSSVDWNLTFVGDGSTRPSIEAQVAGLGLDHRVRFLPFLSQDSLWNILQECHLLCHAVEYEGLGKIIIETMALGVPVLASDVPPINGYITDGQNGFLSPNKPEAWGERIGFLARNRRLLNEVSVRSMAYVGEQYDSERNVRLYEERFRSLVFYQRAVSKSVVKKVLDRSHE